MTPEVPKGTELVDPQGSVPMPTLTADQITCAAEAITARTDAHKRMIQACARYTFEGDWKDFGGIPYLQGKGAERLMSPLGLVMNEPKFTEEREGNHIFVTCSLSVSWPQFDVPPFYAIGDCDTLDKFWDSGDRSDRCAFNQYLVRAEGDERLARRLLLPDVRKKALNNALSRAICGILGIRGVPAAYLAELGFNIQGIKFKKGATKESAKKTKASKKSGGLVTVSGLVEEPEGSVVSLRAACKGGYDNPKYINYSVTDGTHNVYVKMWKNDAITGPESWATDGAEAYFEKVTVGSWQGKPQFTATTIEPAEEEPSGE